MYPVVFFDALRVKIREDAVVRNKAVYLALGVRRDGTRDILGLWIENTEGAKFWMKVFNDLKTRGVNDILIAVTDGLKGMPEALGAVFPATTLQTCIVHLIRNSLDYASWKDRKLLAAGIAPIYTAASAEAAEAALDAFEDGAWGRKFPTVVAAWRRAWDAGDPVLRVPAGGAAGDLHHQRDRERECAAAQDHQDARARCSRRGSACPCRRCRPARPSSDSGAGASSRGSRPRPARCSASITRSTVPRLPLSRPVMTTTWSPLRMLCITALPARARRSS